MRASRALESLDRTLSSLAPGDPLRKELLDLRVLFASQEETMGEAREAIEKLEQIVKKVTSPANRIGTFLHAANKETAQIVVGGADYYCNIDPRIPMEQAAQGHPRPGQ